MFITLWIEFEVSTVKNEFSKSISAAWNELSKSIVKTCWELIV